MNYLETLWPHIMLALGGRWTCELTNTVTFDFRYQRLGDLDCRPTILCACADGVQQTILVTEIPFLYVNSSRAALDYLLLYQWQHWLWPGEHHANKQCFEILIIYVLYFQRVKTNLYAKLN